jgi:hypothetical protein
VEAVGSVADDAQQLFWNAEFHALRPPYGG